MEYPGSDLSRSSNRIQDSLEHLKNHLYETKSPFRCHVIKLVEVADQVLSEATSLMDNVYSIQLKDRSG